MAEVQSLSSCCKIHKRQMRSSNKKGAEDKYFGLFTPQKDNKYNIKKTSYFFLSWSSEQTGQLGQTGETGQTSQRRQTGQTDLIFKLDFPGNLCRAAFTILVIFFVYPFPNP